MSATERIPRANADTFAAVTALTDTFCAKQLNEEYRAVIHRVVANLARKRPSPLLKGKEKRSEVSAQRALGHDRPFATIRHRTMLSRRSFPAAAPSRCAIGPTERNLSIHCSEQEM